MHVVHKIDIQIVTPSVKLIIPFICLTKQYRLHKFTDMTHINLIYSDSFEMIQNNFKGKIHLQYRRLHGNPPSLCPAVMERYVEQRAFLNCREVKASGAVREHLRYIVMGRPCSPLGPVSVHVHKTRQHGRQTGGLKSVHSCRVRGYRDMVGLLTTGVLQCMDTGPSGQTSWEGRLSAKHFISCQQALQAGKRNLTISFLGFCFGPSCDRVISRVLGTDITVKSVRILLMKRKQMEKMPRLWVFTVLLFISKVQISKCILFCSHSSCWVIPIFRSKCCTYTAKWNRPRN